MFHKENSVSQVAPILLIERTHMTLVVMVQCLYIVDYKMIMIRSFHVCNYVINQVIWFLVLSPDATTNLLIVSSPFQCLDNMECTPLCL